MYVVNLARETNALVLLPAALLFCCANEITDIFRGVTFNGMHIDLSVQDQEAVVLGRHRLAQRARRFTHRAMFTVPTSSDLCKDPRGCHRTSLTYLHEFNVRGWINPFEEPVREGWPVFCTYCRAQKMKVYAESIVGVWAHLPSAFNLPAWDTLKATTELEPIL